MSVTRWSIWLAGLDPVVGSEQGKTRPVLVISDTRLTTFSQSSTFCLLQLANLADVSTLMKQLYPSASWD